MSPALVVPGVLLVLASLFDVRSRQIPDVFPLLLLAWAPLSRALGLQEADWVGMGLGLLTGTAVGLLLFRLGALGGGDAKLLIGLGAVLGPLAFGIVFAWVALVGGILALGARLRRQTEVVYGPAIALGYVLAVVFT